MTPMKWFSWLSPKGRNQDQDQDQAGSQSDYQHRMVNEIEYFSDVANLQDLPPIFGYWSNRYVRPWFEELGTTHPEALFTKYMALAAERSANSRPRFLSIGAGDCRSEVEMAQTLLSQGVTDFSIECMDINTGLLERGLQLAAEAGLDGRIVTVKADFNDWSPDGKYDAVMANQCLHHVTNLEGLFDGVQSGLSDRGLFIVSDMIGRNGHQRWPEALTHVQRFWDRLPDRYKYNHQSRNLEVEYVNRDYSVGCFEGVRAQDILPLLIKRFDFPVFIGFGNVVDVFIDRAYGYNFDPESPEDLKFVDELHECDECGFASGELTPTHMTAVLCRRGSWTDDFYNARGLTPEKSLRKPG
jgi:SAM-dependent methyltransferase